MAEEIIDGALYQTTVFEPQIEGDPAGFEGIIDCEPAEFVDWIDSTQYGEACFGYGMYVVCRAALP